MLIPHWRHILFFWRLHLRRERLSRGFGRRARRWIREVLDRRLGVIAAKRLEGGASYKRLCYRVETAQGTVFLKLYRGEDGVRLARRFVCAHSVLREGGFSAPEMLFVDDSPDSLRQWGLSAIALKWIEGEEALPTDAASAGLAMFNLGALHQVGAKAWARDPARFRNAGLPTTNREWFDRELLRFSRDFQEGLPSFGQGDANLLAHVVKREFESVWASPTEPTLLHLDYTPRNVIRLADGSLITLDFDNSAVGDFGFDLGQALVTFGRRLVGIEWDGSNLEAIVGDRRWDGLTDAYFQTVRPTARAHWERGARAFLLWGCVRSASNLAKGAANPFRYHRGERREFQRQAWSQWSRLAAFARNNA